MRVAVYGTFRSGEALSDYLEYLRMHGTTKVIEVTGLKLFVLGMAPGAKITGDQNDKAVIELIDADIDDERAAHVLEMLDQIEGVAQGMYERGYITTPKGEALIYTKCGSVEGCIEITDWMEWQRKGNKEKEQALQKAITHSQAIYVQ